MHTSSNSHRTTLVRKVGESAPLRFADFLQFSDEEIIGVLPKDLGISENWDIFRFAEGKRMVVVVTGTYYLKPFQIVFRGDRRGCLKVSVLTSGEEFLRNLIVPIFT